MGTLSLTMDPHCDTYVSLIFLEHMVDHHLILLWYDTFCDMIHDMAGEYLCTPSLLSLFFANYTIHRRHPQRTHTHPYEYTHANPTPRSIFEDCAGKSSRLTKSPQAPRCRRERRLPLNAQSPLNPEKFAPMGSRTQDLRCYQGSCNH
jgi:hypothetical protein